MKFSVFGALALATMALSGLSAQNHSPDTETQSAAEAVALAPTLRLPFTAFEARVEAALKNAVAPGFVFVVVEDDATLLAQGFGYADIDKKIPINADTVYPLGSISKTFIGTAAAIAAANGQFDLAEPLGNYSSLPVDGPGFNASDVSFLHLATHTSGIVDHDPTYEKEGYAMGRGVHPTPLGEFLRSYASKGGEFYDADANFSGAMPGKRYAYSNIASGLAAQALSDKLQTPFQTYTAKTIFEPLGMMSTAWFRDELNPQQIGTLYMRTDTGFQPYPPYALATWPDGGLRTTGNALARYLIAFMNGGKLEGKQVLPRKAVTLALSGIGLSDVQDLPDDEILAGLFWGTSTAPSILQERPLTGHNGVDPGVWTFMQFDPITRRGVIAIANTDLETNDQVREFYTLAYSLLVTDFDYQPGEPD